MDTDRQSILSHGEREIAAMFRQGHSVEDIASAREQSIPAIEKARDRIRAKTDRAVVTLLESPFAAETLDDLDERDRAKLQSLVVED